MYLSRKVPRQKLDRILGRVGSSQRHSPLFRIGPLLDVDPGGSLWVLDGFVWEGAKTSQQSRLSPLPVSNEEQLDCTIVDRPEKMKII